MADDLKIQCSHTPADSLSATNEPSYNTPSVNVTVSDHGQRCHAVLDAQGARALFNWLGTWLVTEGAGHG